MIRGGVQTVPGGEAEPDPGHGLGLRGVARRASPLSVASVVSALLGVPTGFLAARWLGAAKYGDAQFVLLAFFFASLARVGVFEGGLREYIHHRANRDHAAAAHAKDVSVTVEASFAVVPGLALTVVALFLDEPVRRVGLFLGPVAALVSSMAGFCGGIALADESFTLVAKATVVRAVVAGAIVLTLTPHLGAVAIVLAPIVADAVVTTIYLAADPSVRVHPTFDAAVTKRLFRAGFPLGAAAIVYWVYRQVGTASIALHMPARQLGLYSFAAAPILLGTRALAQAESVVRPRLWSAMARADDTTWGDAGTRLVVGMAVVAAATTNMAQAALPPVIRQVTPHFTPAIPIVMVLALNVFVLTVAAVPTLMLESTRVNKQARTLAVWVAALAVNVAANAAVLAVWDRAILIAFNDVWVQAIVVVAMYAMAARYAGRFATGAYVTVTMTAVLMVALSLVLDAWTGPAHPTLARNAAELAMRAALVAAVWGAAAAAMLAVSRGRAPAASPPAPPPA
jgi:O-antigen/teichoic acid export membrane protein